jgi:hypothetical protein
MDGQHPEWKLESVSIYQTILKGSQPRIPARHYK